MKYRWEVHHNISSMLIKVRDDDICGPTNANRHLRYPIFGQNTTRYSSTRYF